MDCAKVALLSVNCRATVPGKLSTKWMNGPRQPFRTHLDEFLPQLGICLIVLRQIGRRNERVRSQIWPRLEGKASVSVSFLEARDS